MELDKLTYNENVSILRKSNKELRNLKISSKEFRGKALELLAVKDSISKIKQSIASTGSA